MSYIPKIDDYVIWDRGRWGKDEGWVYFYDEDYITIETGVKPRPECKYTNGHAKHKMVHTLLLCHNAYWKELKYVKSRSSPFIQLCFDFVND